MSLLPTAELIPADIISAEMLEIESGFEAIDDQVNTFLNLIISRPASASPEEALPEDITPNPLESKPIHLESADPAPEEPVIPESLPIEWESLPIAPAPIDPDEFETIGPFETETLPPVPEEQEGYETIGSFECETVAPVSEDSEEYETFGPFENESSTLFPDDFKIFKPTVPYHPGAARTEEYPPAEEPVDESSDDPTQTNNDTAQPPSSTSSGRKIDPLLILFGCCALVWVLGTIGMLVYALVGYLSLYRKTRMRLHLKDNIYLCDDIKGPFAFGCTIYLPSDLSVQDLPHVLAHEKAHIKRRDYIWRPLAYTLLSVYWFHPLLWVAFFLFCKDMELACDELAIGNCTTEEKKHYSMALVNCSASKRTVSVFVPAFGEEITEKRVKNVLNYKKPSKSSTVISTLLLVMLAACFLTTPIGFTQSTEAVTTPSEAAVSTVFSDVLYDCASANNRAPHQIGLLGTAKRLSISLNEYNVPNTNNSRNTAADIVPTASTSEDLMPKFPSIIWANDVSKDGKAPVVGVIWEE